jgi:peroxiredoxin
MTRKNQIKFYNRAPDLELEDMQGQPIRLSSLWQQRPVLLAFTRHFGCPQCKEMLAELVAGRERISQAGLNLAVVLQGAAAESAIFAAEFAPGLLCLADPRREAYRAFGLERGDLFQTFLNPQVWKATRAAQEKGFKVQTPPEGQDAMQMSGVFIVATDGRVVLPYYYDHIADHPSLDLLLSGVFSTRWDRDFNGPLGGDIQE